jgi:hypothetical protein
MKKPSFTLLVNSSDGFEDCWIPFFTLLKRYWPEIDIPILLNTEKKTWSFEGLDIICTQAQKNHDNRLTWSECLIEALSQVKTELVLYMQEDYFIEKLVNYDDIKQFAIDMQNNTEIKHIGLTHFGSCAPFEAYHDDKLWKISKNSRYRISTQAGLWRKETLQSLLRPWENGWMFEIFGSVRASKKDELFLTIRRDLSDPLITYQHTGIIKGQWSHFVKDLSDKECITIDFTHRGFYKETPAFIRRISLLFKIASNPVMAFKSLTQ